MDFVLALHGHLPYVLNHGRWPHGSVWLCEATLDTYLPLLDALLTFERQGTPAPVTLGITPVLANQLADPAFVVAFEEYMARRLDACAGAPASLAASGDPELSPLASFWKDRLTKLLELFRSLDGDLLAALRGLEQRGRIELISSAATHGFLPLLGRDESIRLQLLLGAAEHRRLFGRDPMGCWLPECAFRPAGPWAPPGAKPRPMRRGTDEHLRDAGYRYFFVDSHLVRGGAALGYPWTDFAAPAPATAPAPALAPASAADDKSLRSPYVAYRVAGGAGRELFALVRDPASSSQVWSRAQGYPGDEWYLEFHKIRWPDGLRLWRVTGSDADLGAKRRYEPGVAQARVHEHASHFAATLQRTARGQEERGGVVVAPFDAELFGHWWFEGVDFVADVYRLLAADGVRAVTARQHLTATPRRPTIQLTEGSWGKDGDFSMWLNDQTAWTWQRMWALEDAFWAVAPAALAGDAERRALLAEAARSMLLAQGSDWQFIISTGAATDYAEQRFVEHCNEAEEMVQALSGFAPIDPAVLARVDALRSRNNVFPNVLDSVARAIG